MIRPLPQHLDPLNDEAALFQKQYHAVCSRTDRLFTILMCIQWPAAILAGYANGSLTWNGSLTGVHPHLAAAFYLGGLITIFPVSLAFLYPGQRFTRHVMAVCQMLMSALLIHITGGRIESHFHVFGSLAFLAFYLDWEVLVTATVTTLLDHVIMGFYAPHMIFGTALLQNMQLAEHLLWVVFCDVFLITSCIQSLRGLKEFARQDAQQKVLLHRAYHDALTGLGNRLLAHEQLHRMLQPPAHTRSFALLAIDISGLNEVNESSGYRVGDEILVQVGQRLQHLIRTGDTLARMDGNEFVIILDNCREEVFVAAIAQRIVESLNTPFACNDHILSVGASIGICLCPTGTNDIAQVFRHADLALYKVKERGRNDFFVFDDIMREEVERKLLLEERVRIAVHDGLFTLHYQPLVDAEGILIGFEALLRWNDPVIGTVTPNIFIPVAERCGLIIPLGKWVLERACRDAAAWQTVGSGSVSISVNVSPVQLARPEFVQIVIDTLQQSGLKPELLDLELTESVLVEHAGRAAEAMARLKKLGVHLSIDDFGTGYSSLSYLRDLPVHRLKIDRSFIRDIGTSQSARALVASMIEMGRTLKLSVLAEGVETREQLDILRDAGCNEMQGFLFSKAVPEEQAQAFIRQRNLLPPLEAPVEEKQNEKLPIPIDGPRSSVSAAA